MCLGEPRRYARRSSESADSSDSPSGPTRLVRLDEEKLVRKCAGMADGGAGPWVMVDEADLRAAWLPGAA